MSDQFSVYGNPNKTSSWFRPQRYYVPALQHCTEGHHNYKFVNFKYKWYVGWVEVFEREGSIQSGNLVDGKEIFGWFWRTVHPVNRKITVIHCCSSDELDNYMVRDAWILHNNKFVWLTFPISDVWISVPGKTVMYAGECQLIFRVHTGYNPNIQFAVLWIHDYEYQNSFLYYFFSEGVKWRLICHSI